jgi:hypothetical protein
MVRTKEPHNDVSDASFRETNHDATVLHPSMEEKGITTMRLQRLHLSSSPLPHTFAMSCPHSQRVSLLWQRSAVGVLVVIMKSSCK